MQEIRHLNSRRLVLRRT